MKKLALVLISLLAVFAAIYLLGFYPAIKVNGEFISRNSIDKRADISRKLSEEAMADPGEDLDFQAIALETSILDILIEERLRKEFDGNTLEALIKENTSQFPEEMKTFREALNISEGDFNEFILKPVAKKEILGAKLVLKGEDLEKWLAEAKKSADVALFWKKFRWEDGSIKRN